MKRYSADIIEKAVALHRQGYSYAEIGKLCGMKQSMCSYYLSGAVVGEAAKRRLNGIEVAARKRGNDTLRRKFAKQREVLKGLAAKSVEQVAVTPELARIFAALLYWAEGRKTKHMGFINSDPKMIAFFLYCLRRGFEIDEKDLRAKIHLHEYHDREKVLEYWSQVTKIPKKQFYQPYLKPHTGKNKKEGYMGCITVGVFRKDLMYQFQGIWKQLVKEMEEKMI